MDWNKQERVPVQEVLGPMRNMPTLRECRDAYQMYLDLERGESICLSDRAKSVYKRVKEQQYARFLDLIEQRRARKYRRNTCAALLSRIGAQVEGR